MESTLIGKLSFHQTNLTVEQRTRDIFRLSVVTVTGDGVLLASGHVSSWRGASCLRFHHSLRKFAGFSSWCVENRGCWSISSSHHLLLLLWENFKIFYRCLYSFSFLDSLRRFSPRICHLAAIAGLWDGRETVNSDRKPWDSCRERERQRLLVCNKNFFFGSCKSLVVGEKQLMTQQISGSWRTVCFSLTVGGAGSGGKR